MTIALQGSDALVAKASVAGTVTVAVWGRIVGTVYQNLVPAAGSAVTLTGTPTTYYSPGGSAQAIVSFVQMCNPSGASITVTQYSQTGASQTQVGQWVIPTLGRLEYSLEGWKLYDGVGNAQTVGTPGATGPQGLAAQAIALEPDQGEEGMAIPGPVGTTGAQGIQGIQGLQGIAASAIAIEPDQGEEGLPIPGPVGSTGATGAQGVQGLPGVTVQLDADQGDDGMPIPAGVIAVTGTAPIVSSGGTNPAISITPATTVAAGSMAATDKAFLTAFNGSVDIVVTSNAYSNLKCDGATDDTAALNALFAAAPDGSNLVWPAQNSTMVLTAAAVIPSGKHFNFVGWEDGKSNWLQTSPTADHITCGDWYSTFTSINFVTNNTTTTASQTLTSGTVLTVTAVNTSLVAASGTINVGSTAGWQSLTYSARTATTVTLSATGTGSSVIGAPLVFKTAGAALNAGNFVGIDAINCSTTCCFNGYIASGSTANSSIIENWGALNNINFSIQIDAVNWNGIITNCSCDCTVNSRTLSHLEILQCGSITGQNNQFIRGMFNMRLGSTTAAYPAGVFGVYFAESFFDNAGTDAVRVQGISAVQRIKLTACWLSSAQAGNGLNFASTATTLPTDIELTACNIYSNSANGITGAGVQDYKVIGGEIAGNVTAGVAITAAAGSVTSVTLANVRIGPTGGIGANGTGVTIATGTYASVVVRGCDLTGNTTALTLGTVTVAIWSRFALTDNPGWNPHGAVTTPTFPTTTTVVTNTTGHRVSAWTKMGATAPTAMSVNGVATAVPLLNTLIPIVLDPGGTVVFTYATAPTWVWVGN